MSDRQSLERLDAIARQRAQSLFDRPLALEAGAGTGKTTALVARVVAWCLIPGWERAAGVLGEDATNERVAARVLSRVVAITFTEAASAEMEARVAAALVEVERGGAPRGLDEERMPATDVERRGRARALLGALDHLVVRTIHAFCRRLLAAHPLEAGLDPNFQVDADGSELELVVLEVLEARIADAYGHTLDESHLALGRAGIGPRELGEALLALASSGVPADALVDDLLALDRVADAVCALSQSAMALTEFEAARLQTVPGRAKVTRETAIAAARLADTLHERADDLTLDELCVMAREVHDACGVRLGAWGRGRYNKAEAETLGADGAEFRIRARRLRELVRVLALAQPEILRHAQRALAPLLEEVHRQLRARGVATFNSLLVDARDLLRDHDAVRRRVSAGLDQLLVDEFQDTDGVQCDIVRLLAFGEPRPGLFVVGDPKQSIYGWRRADLGAYDAFMADIEAAGGELHRLSVNFRSVPALLAEVDRVIEPIMHRALAVQPAYEPLVACPERASSPGFSTGDWAPVEYRVSWRSDRAEGGPAKKTLALDAARIEARAIALDLAELHENHGFAWRSFAVLFRSTGDLEVYLSALRDADVPYEVVRDRQYYQRREIIDASALVRAVLDPNDHLALVTLLRSPMVGVPDAALIPLWARGLPRLLTELRRPRPRELKPIVAAATEVAATLQSEGVPGLDRVSGWEHNLIAVANVLALLRVSFEQDAPDEFVELLRRSMLVEGTAAARYLGRYRVANLERFFRDLLEALEQGVDAHAALRALRKSVGEAREAEEARPRDSIDDAVRVLTIHQAKGLDFEHVYLAQLHKGRPQRETASTQAEQVDGRWEWLLFGVPSLRFDLVRARRERVEGAERVRTLYVAMTRAKNRMVMLGNWPSAPVVKSVDDAQSYMDLLQSRAVAAPPLVPLMREASVPEAQGWCDVADARWSFAEAVAVRADRGASSKSHARVELPDPRRVVEAARELDERRDRARERMSRSIGGAASSEGHGAATERRTERYLGPDEGGQRAADAGAARDVALAAGTAVHRVLETWSFDRGLDNELERQTKLLRSYVQPLVSDDRLAATMERAERAVVRLGGSTVLARFEELAPHFVARELPVLLAPADDEAAPVGYVSGAIDLVYRDPEDGRIVVVDYKTDRVETDDQVEQRAAGYAGQGRVYARALQLGLGLDHTPRFELWFLHADRIVET